MATVKFYLMRPQKKKDEKTEALPPSSKKKKKDEDLKDTEVTIYAVVTIDSKNRFTCSTREKILPRYWDKAQKEAKSSYTGHVGLNLRLGAIKENLIHLWRNNITLDKSQLKEMGDNLIKFGIATQQEKKNFFEVLEVFNANYKKGKHKDTLAKFATLEKRLRAFNKNYKFTLDTMDQNFYDKFKEFLHDLPNPKYKNCSLYYDPKIERYVVRPDTNGEPVLFFDDNVYKYITGLITVIKWANKRGFEFSKLKSDELFKQWGLKQVRHKPITLTTNELCKVEALEFNVHNVIPADEYKSIVAVYKAMGHGQIRIDRRMERLAAQRVIWFNHSRDYFSLECRTGQRISDLKLFHRDSINGNLWTFTQKKGNKITGDKRIIFPLVGYSAPALEIFEKYNYDLPTISQSRLNKSIKTICKIAGIDKEIYIDRWAGTKHVRVYGPKYKFISTHVGRKTFVTKTLQFLSPKLVMDLTGIRSFETLKHYTGESETETIESALMSIQNNTTIMKKSA